MGNLRTRVLEIEKRKLIMKIKRLIFAAVVIISLFFVMVIFAYKNTQNKIKKIAIHTEEVYGDIEFSGKVDSIIEIRRGGRTYGLMCIDLDYSNVDSFYRYDKYTTLKIKNNKAVLPTGFLGNESTENNDVIFKSSFISVNINQNNKIIYYINNDSIVEDWYFRNSNLKEEDMSKWCSLPIFRTM